MRSAVVFGGAGQLGAAVAERLLSAGWRVCVVSRSGRLPGGALAGAERLDGTGRSRAALIEEAGPVDAVFDPTAYGEADALDLLSARRWFSALVTVSSASVYADPAGRSLVAISQSGMPKLAGPIAEDAPTVEPDGKTYAGRKAQLERRLLDSGAAVSILRPCAVYGTPSTHPREWWLIKRALDGREAIPVAYGARSVFHTSNARGVAELAALCMERPGRRVLNAADRTALTVREIAAGVAAATGLRLPLAPFDGPPTGPAHVGSTPWSVEHRFALDTGRAAALGWNGGDYPDRVGPVCDWVLEVARDGDWRAQFSGFAQYGYDPFDYAAEDSVLAGR
jgi:nucleoside-diphosphate-sugar epimerase